MTKRPTLRKGLAGVLCVVLLTLTARALGQEAAGIAAGFDGERAMADIAKQLSFGKRAMGEPGHAKTAAYIRDSLEALGFAIETQSWVESRFAGRAQPLTNIIARSDPGNSRRIVLATHYDSIIRAYADPDKTQAPMPGANNSASGVALLLEVARALHAHPSSLPFGLDLIFFDGEEGPLSLGAGDPNWRALGSPYFAQHLATYYPADRPVLMIDFDMVCYAHSVFRPERLSVGSSGQAGARFFELGQSAFPARFSPTPLNYAISDDQLAFAELGIPSFLVIGFEYDPYFNTTQDTLDKCSAETLEAVGKTLLTYLQQFANRKD